MLLDCNIHRPASFYYHDWMDFSSGMFTMKFKKAATAYTESLNMVVAVFGATEYIHE